MQKILKKQTVVRGFSLIELMIAVAIVAILAVVAVPSYQNHVIRGNRAAAQAMMMELANRNQQFFLANRAFATTTADLSFTVPSEVSKNYGAPTITSSQFLDSSCAVSADTGTAPSFVIAVAPVATSKQARDGTLYLSSTGVKCPAGKW